MRVVGGVYLVVKLGPLGMPVEHFLMDPPVPVERTGWDVKRQGITIVPDPQELKRELDIEVPVKDRTTKSGIVLDYSAGEVKRAEDRVTTWHAIDWVGENNYPFVADWVEETRRLGLSSRIQRTAEFERLGPGSCLFIVHGRGFIANSQDYYEAHVAEWLERRAAGQVSAIISGSDVMVKRCPKNNQDHDRMMLRQMMGNEMCAALWWQDLDLSANGVMPTPNPAMPPRTVTRDMPSFHYIAQRRADGVNPRYLPAIVARFTGFGIEVVGDRSVSGLITQAVKDGLDRARKSRLTVELVEE